jgi:hypothetical protein
LRVIAGQRENIFDAERIEVFEKASEFSPVFAHARHVDVGNETASARSHAYAKRIVPRRTARVAGDTPCDNAGYLAKLRGDLEKLRLAGNPACHELDNVAEPAGLKGIA